MSASNETGSAYREADPIGEVETTAFDEWRAAIALRGELDVATAPELRAAFDGHLAAGRRVIHVDVGGVNFIDSTVLGELINASRRCQADQGSLILTNVPPRVRRLVQISGLDGALVIDTAGAANPQAPA
jgi:anti-sigma B factor antagonist